MGVWYQMCQNAMEANSHPQEPAIQRPKVKVISLYKKLRQNRKQALEHHQTHVMLCIPSGSAKISSNATLKKPRNIKKNKCI
jgi:hypothetical protein